MGPGAWVAWTTFQGWTMTGRVLRVQEGPGGGLEAMIDRWGNGQACGPVALERLRPETLADLEQAAREAVARGQ